MTTSIVESPSPVLINIAFSPALGLNDKEPFEICLRISLTIITKYKKAMKLKKIRRFKSDKNDIAQSMFIKTVTLMSVMFAIASNRVALR